MRSHGTYREHHACACVLLEEEPLDHAVVTRRWRRPATSTATASADDIPANTTLWPSLSKQAQPWCVFKLRRARACRR